MRFTILAVIAFSILTPAFGQRRRAMEAIPDVPSAYNPRLLFGPEFYPDQGNEFRSGIGAPGPKYWQNRADYLLKAEIDTVSETLTSSEEITYTNNSPDSLWYLWLYLEQNTYREDARSNFYTPFHPNQHTDGYDITSVSLRTAQGTAKADYVINDTRMQIRLPKALGPNGGKITLLIHYHYAIPGVFGGRTTHFPTKNGTIYEIAQWYPRMCVYDNVRGWNTLPFLGAGEFFLEYGDFDYSVTVPWDMIVAGSGELVNPEAVLSSTEMARLRKARMSDETVMIRSDAEVGDPATRPVRSGKLTWHFQMRNSRDVSFGASRAYMWDAAKVNLPGGKSSLAMSVYPVESEGNDAWGRATEYLKKSIEYFSEKWVPYTYPVAVNEAGMAGGMEYPGIVFDGYQDKGKELYWVTAHEIGHNWFPMMVGSDERRFAWMDEGFNTFIDVYADDAFNHGEYAPKRDGEYAPGGGNPADEIVPLLQDTAAPVIMTKADNVTERYRHPIDYFKPAFGLVLLREQILGPDRFDYAFRQYIKRWAFKHPQPDDFFRSMDNGGGEDLTWFWREWFFHNWTLDLEINEVSYVGGDPSKGIKVTVSNLQPMALPCVVEADLKDGTKQRITLPVETWLSQHTVVFTIPTTKPVDQVVLDPDKGLPDSNRQNNVMKVP